MNKSICEKCTHATVCKWKDELEELNIGTPDIVIKSGSPITIQVMCKLYRTQSTGLRD